MRHSEYTIADAAIILRDRDVPVLVIDTCSLLDIIRIPTRVDNNYKRAETILEKSSQSLSMATENPPKLSIVIPPLVPDEWKRNQPKISRETEGHFSKLDSMIEVADVLANALSSESRLTSFSDLKLHDDLSDISMKLLYSGIWLSSDEDIRRRAVDRALLPEAPAKHGTFKDCIIYEHCRELFSQLRGKGLSKKLVLFTSNTDDFCEPNSSVPKKPIKTELDGLSATLTTQWNWTLHELTA